eukprot:1512332-Rhodomonas_salina.1
MSRALQTLQRLAENSRPFGPGDTIGCGVVPEAGLCFICVNDHVIGFFPPPGNNTQAPGQNNNHTPGTNPEPWEELVGFVSVQEEEEDGGELGSSAMLFNFGSSPFVATADTLRSIQERAMEISRSPQPERDMLLAMSPEILQELRQMQASNTPDTTLNQQKTHQNQPAKHSALRQPPSVNSFGSLNPALKAGVDDVMQFASLPRFEVPFAHTASTKKRGTYSASPSPELAPVLAPMVVAPMLSSADGTSGVNRMEEKRGRSGDDEAARWSEKEVDRAKRAMKGSGGGVGLVSSAGSLGAAQEGKMGSGKEEGSGSGLQVGGRKEGLGTGTQIGPGRKVPKLWEKGATPTNSKPVTPRPGDLATPSPRKQVGRGAGGSAEGGVRSSGERGRDRQVEARAQ